MQIKLSRKQKQFLFNCFIICSVLSITAIIFLRFLFPNKSTQDLSTVVSGILGTSFSFFGSVLVYMALKSQVKANKLIQDQIKEQEKSSYRQNFETTFFNLLNIHHSIVDSMDFNASEVQKLYPRLYEYISRNSYYYQIQQNISNGNEFKSRDVFKFINSTIIHLILDDLILKREIENNRYDTEEFFVLENYFNQIGFYNSNIDLNNHNTNTRFVYIYRIIYSIVHSDFGHYFRNLFRIFKLIDECKFDENEVEDFKIKYRYTSIIRSQLSNDEISLLFFNCLTEFGSKKFKPLLEKYSILKVINDAYPYRYYLLHYHVTATYKNWEDNIEEHINRFK